MTKHKDSSLPEAQAWIEAVTFVECPSCFEVIELGTGALVGDDDNGNCSCGVEFRMLPPKEER